MTKVNLVINGTDTVATGEESDNLTDAYGQRYKKAILLSERDVIGGDFRELQEHLRRLIGYTAGWTYVHLPSGRHQRRYLFRDSTVTLEEVTVKPEKPSGVAALVGEDPYTTPGDINFLLKGDRFRAEKPLPGGRKQVAYGTAAMDGNAISPRYGWLTFEAEGNQSTADAKRKAFDNVEGGYINVYWDHREPGDYDPAAPGRDQGEHWPNEGLNLRDGWQIWVLPEVAKRKTKALADHRKTVEEEKTRAAVESAKRDLEAVQRKLARAEEALRKLG